MMIAWDVLNSAFRVFIAVACLWNLYRFGALFSGLERWGMGFASGCSILTITVIWQAERSPFDGWATSIFSIGMCMYFVGRGARHRRHYLANRSMVDSYRGRR